MLFYKYYNNNHRSVLIIALLNYPICLFFFSSPKTNISELFAIMRQWVPQTQRYLALLTREVGCFFIEVQPHQLS